MLILTFFLVAGLTDDTGCIDGAAFDRELSARAPLAALDVVVTAEAEVRKVRIVVTNMTPATMRELSVRPEECKDLPRAIAVIAATIFAQRDVLDGPTLIVEDSSPTAIAASPPPLVAEHAGKPAVVVRPAASLSAEIGLGAPLVFRASAGGGARVGWRRIIIRLEALARQDVPASGAAFAALTSIVVGANVGYRVDAFGVELIPRVGADAGGGLAVRLDGKQLALVPRAEVDLGLDVAVGAAEVGVVVGLPLLPVAFVDGRVRTQEPPAWAGVRVNVAF